MEWFNIIVGAISTLIGLVGGGVGIYFWKENKALKQKEVEAKAIENELQQAGAWKNLYDSERERTKEKGDRLRALYQERDRQKEEINDCRFRIQQLEWYHCTVNGCPNRRPPHAFDEDGIEVIAKKEPEDK